MSLDEKFEDALFDKGVALSKMGKNDDALVCMEKIIEINPENENAHEAIHTFKKSGAFGFV